MQLDEAQERFIEMWGTLGTEWGISRSMAQIHALLLLSPKPLCGDDVMEQLQIARGNANTNLRALRDWGLVKKELITGDRKEYFVAYKDMWHVAKQVVLHRKKRELDPLLLALKQLKDIESTPSNAE
jgi:DNA-binding transcriptional regulator GbsR (MarR family)